MCGGFVVSHTFCQVYDCMWRGRCFYLGDDGHVHGASRPWQPECVNL